MESVKIDYNPERNRADAALSDAKKLVQQSAMHEFNIDHLKELHGLDSKKAKEIYKIALNFAKKEISTFWIVILAKDMSVKGIKLNKPSFIDFLVSNGIYRLPLNNKDDEYVQIKSNIVDLINDRKIKKLVIDYIESLPETFDLITQDQLKQFIMDGASTYFSKALLDFLPALEEGQTIDGRVFQWNRDTKTHSFHYFKDCVVVVDKDGIKKLKYDDLYRFIWRSQILDRDYVITKDKGEFNKFIELICDKDPDRIKSARSIIGYLLHSYKNKAKLWSIVLGDEDMSEDANGGTGKGLFWQGISKFKELCKIDGKGFNFTSQFAFQRVQKSTQIILFDDIDKSFDFEKLFSVITEGIPVEYKGKDEFYINFEDSPKIGITTNHTIKSSGTSVSRRKIDIELSDYFNEKWTPADEFGHQLFDDWDKAQWANFNYFMLVDCLQNYMKTGIIKYNTESSRKKTLIANTNRLFPQFADDEIKIGEKIDRKDFCFKFNEVCGYKNSTQKIMHFVHEYAKFNDCDMGEMKSNGSYYFVVFKEKQQNLKEDEEEDMPF